MINYLAVSIFGLLMATAALGDVFTLRIPNWLVLTMPALFVPFALAAGMPWPSLGIHLLVGLAMLVTGFALFVAGVIGGGDAKLLAAAAVWIGWPAVLNFLFWTCISGGLLAVFILATTFNSKQRRNAGNSWRRGVVPYGVALAAGAFLSVSQSWWFTSH